MSHVEEHSDHEHRPSYGIYVVTWIALLALTAITAAAPAQPTAPALVERLRTGGYVIVFSHAATGSELLKSV